MRTTITLEPDVETLVKRAMRERDLTFKEAVNEAIRSGLTAPRAGAAPSFLTYRMGAPRVDVTKALRLAAELEDDELARKLAQRK